AGGAADPNAAAAAAKAALVSRTNTMFSIPMLFYMGAAKNLPIALTPDSNTTLFWVIFAAILVALEFNALKGKQGPMTTVKGVITCGFALTAVVYLLMELTF
ncbi:MAG: hypothetical protein N2578_10210, partial [Bdellovibrionaceae bacterium]|nr:hypothetical protein [Pseudobdellovibrionaceae bacterium]